MHLGCVLIACNSGGPLESVEDTVTGFLHPPDQKIWARAIQTILGKPSNYQIDWKHDGLKTLKQNAQARVQRMFTEEAFGSNLVKVLDNMDKPRDAKKHKVN